MNDFLLKELKTICDGYQPNPESDEKLFRTATTIMEFAKEAHREGLLILEQKRQDLDQASVEQYLDILCDLLAGGAASNQLWEVGEMLYCTSNLSGVDALCFFLYLKGCQLMAEDERPFLFEYYLRSLLPVCIRANWQS